MSKEQLLRRTAAVGAALGIALGATACENPFSDPNQISVCPVGWGDGATEIGYPSDLTASEAAARLEAGRTELVARIHTATGSNNPKIRTEALPGMYKRAASLLIEQPNETFYDTSQADLETPREMFCNKDVIHSIQLSPAYVQAESALEASGISATPAGE